MPPTVPFNHYKNLRNQQNKTLVILCYSMLQYSRLGYACFEHSNFLKVNDGEWIIQETHQLLDESLKLSTFVPKEGYLSAVHAVSADHILSNPKSNYELFNCNNFLIRYWSWNYRGCWHQ